ncbi:MAG: glutamine synthetase family protein [Actinomycetota bacterium]|nr:glutamine synthetase family protein [Actinomycetota bacterium]
MIGEQLTGFLYCDLVGIVRGRLLAAADVETRLTSGVGWVPANISLTAFGGIAEPNPHGSTGDLRLRPDPATHVCVGFGEEVSALEFFLCDVVGTDGSPWECCPRTFLSTALKALEREAGVQLRAAFEHEFQCVDDSPPPLPFSLEAQRRVEPFGPVVMATLRQAGVEPELFLPEYGEHQFEVVCAPAEGMAAADRSVTAKEVIREVARRLGRCVTFAPLRHQSAVGNGAHIHFSFVDDLGRAPMYDQERPGRLSRVAGQFAAGILRHAPALAALVAPGVSSFLRLAPHRWSAGAACLGERNRETLLRISPVVETPGHDPAHQYNLEFRAADATACPYLALGAIVRAGLDGVRQGLECPPILSRDPASLTDEELAEYGAPTMPGTLEEALESLHQDEIARGWFPPLLYESYVGVKRAELSLLEGLDHDEVCRRYVAAY